MAADKVPHEAKCPDRDERVHEKRASRPMARQGGTRPTDDREPRSPEQIRDARVAKSQANEPQHDHRDRDDRKRFEEWNQIRPRHMNQLVRSVPASQSGPATTSIRAAASE